MTSGKDSNKLERNLRQPTGNSSKQKHSIRQDSSHQKRDIRQPEKNCACQDETPASLKDCSANQEEPPASQEDIQPARIQPASQRQMAACQAEAPGETQQEH